MISSENVLYRIVIRKHTQRNIQKNIWTQKISFLSLYSTEASFQQSRICIWPHNEDFTGALDGITHHRLTKKGCSSPCMIWSSRKTFRTSSLSMHFCLFMYFIAYIFLVSRFCTMQTWVTAKRENIQANISKEQKGSPSRHPHSWVQVLVLKSC